MPSLPLSPIRTGGKPAKLSDHRIEIDGLSFEVHRSDRRKTMQITVERSGELSIVAPSTVSTEHLVDFVEEKLLWVHTKIEEKSRLQKRAPTKEFVEGEGFLYLGKSYRLRLVEKQLVDLSLKNGRFCLRESSVHRGREVFVSWYARRAQQWFEKQVSEYANRMGVIANEVKAQDLGFRWGSFGSDGRVSFHWKAILLPPTIAQYVVVHELAHAHHPDHSAKFWIKVEQHLPDWRWRKTWLAEHGIQVEGL
ncbi:M48 family metallopeptidase [Antarcticimicrobium sediminis]|uniref:M48 family peptidase n=1 Tax=Antarcticimicrobium sediminis TaxID=2546227 RepID=A0A4R5EK58_9RHOB|nr:SprT family zinc-dependent metalloprotease [Antarcticimicrobium sediminis]TDE34822.1 M48 family peptidase [Antarcticimicrobium sediminis]